MDIVGIVLVCIWVGINIAITGEVYEAFELSDINKEEFKKTSILDMCLVVFFSLALIINIFLKLVAKFFNYLDTVKPFQDKK